MQLGSRYSTLVTIQLLPTNICHAFNIETESVNPATAQRETPLNWGDTLTGTPVLDCRIRGATPALVRRWQSIPPDIEQTALDQHFVSIHLSGAKRLYRRGEGANLTRDVSVGAYSVVPAGAAFRWTTEGPVDFMHLYLEPRTIDDFVTASFDRDPRGIGLQDSLGATDRLIGSLATELLAELSQDDAQPAYIDDLMHLIVFRTLRLHSNVRTSDLCAPHALPPFKLRRAIEFTVDNLAAPIGVAEIAAVTGLSAFHFSRAFRCATGMPPYAYLLAQRIAAAKTMLMTSCASMTDIAAQCGFTSLSQFSRMFKRVTGIRPTDFRNRC